MRRLPSPKRQSAQFIGAVPRLHSRTGQKSIESCYCESGFMRQKIKFASRRPVSRLWSAFGLSDVRQWRTSGLCPHPAQSPATASEHVTPISASLINDQPSRITAFLIDTPAIRIAPKSFLCITGTHSNRHSSGAWNARHDEANAPERRQIQAPNPARLPGPNTTGTQNARKGGGDWDKAKKRGARGVSGGMMALCTGGGIAPATEPLLGGCS